MSSDRIRLGGRDFVSARRSTLEQDHWFMSRVRKSRLDCIRKQDDEDEQAFGQRLLGELIASSYACELLAAILVPAGEKWSAKAARETAAHFLQLEEPEDKATFNNLLLSMWLDFFVSGLRSSTSSPISSGDSGAQPSDGTIPATRSSASGVRWFDRWRRPTGSRRRGRSGGRWSGLFAAISRSWKNRRSRPGATTA